MRFSAAMRRSSTDAAFWTRRRLGASSTFITGVCTAAQAGRMTSKTPETNFCHPLLPLCFEAAALVMVSLRSSLSSAALGPAFLTSTFKVGDALAAAVESWIRGCAARRTTVLNDARSMVSTNVEQSCADRSDR